MISLVRRWATLAFSGLLVAEGCSSESCPTGVYRLAEVIPIEGSCDPATMASLSTEISDHDATVNTCGIGCGDSWRRVEINGATLSITFTMTKAGLDGDVAASIAERGCSEHFSLRYDREAACAPGPVVDAFLPPDAAPSPDAS